MTNHSGSLGSTGIGSLVHRGGGMCRTTEPRSRGNEVRKHRLALRASSFVQAVASGAMIYQAVSVYSQPRCARILELADGAHAISYVG